MTELHGGVCHRTSTPHKSGNKTKEKKKKIVGAYILSNIQYKLIHKAIRIHLKLTLFSLECKSVTTNRSDIRQNCIALLSVGS